MRVQQWAPWCITALSIGAMVVLGKKRPYGWVIHLTGTVAGFVYNAVTLQLGFLPAQIAGGYLAVRNYLEWTKDTSPDKEACHACAEGGDMAGRRAE